MSLTWVVVGSFIQMGLSAWLLMMAAFTGGGIADGRKLSKIQLKVLDLSLFVLPGTCFIAAAIVIFQYLNNGHVTSYLWYSFPIFVFVAYVVYVRRM